MDCKECKEKERHIDDLTEALRLEDGRAAEIFSEYWSAKNQRRFLREQREKFRVWADDVIKFFDKLDGLSVSLDSMIEELRDKYQQTFDGENTPKE